MDPEEILKLKKELAYYKQMYGMNKSFETFRADEVTRLREENERLKEELDHREKAKESDFDEKEWMQSKIDRYENEIRGLKRKAEEDRQTICYLTNIVNSRLDGDPEADILLSSYANGRRTKKKVSDETDQRILSLRKEGVTIREIANMERVSIGYVHKVTRRGQ